MGTYRTQQRPLAIVGMYNFAIAHKSIPDDLPMRSPSRCSARMPAEGGDRGGVGDGRGELDQEHLPALHPGAARYLRENGQAVPDNLVMA
jgi:TRAP-type uncharacterized transport system substrate-binding protein